MRRVSPPSLPAATGPRSSSADAAGRQAACGGGQEGGKEGEGRKERPGSPRWPMLMLAFCIIPPKEEEVEEGREGGKEGGNRPEAAETTAAAAAADALG